MRDNLKEIYPTLTHEERFKLLLEAKGRGDERETNRLKDSCPWRTYTAKDAAFTDLVDAAQWVVDTFTIVWLETSRKYRAAELVFILYLDGRSSWMQGYIIGANNAWKNAGGQGVCFDVENREPTSEEVYEIGLSAVFLNPPKKLEGIFRKAGGELKGAYEGFTRFCDAIDIEPEKLLSWYPPILEDTKAYKDLIEGEIPVDKEISDAIFQLLYVNWLEVKKN